MTRAAQRVMWCRYLSLGPRFVRFGFHHSAARNAGPIVFAVINDLEAAGLITLAPTALDTPARRHVRATLTEAGRALASQSQPDAVAA